MENAATFSDAEAVSAESAGDAFGAVIDHAADDKARVVLTRDGKPVAAIVPIEDYDALEAIEDSHDAEISARLWPLGKPRDARLVFPMRKSLQNMVSLYGDVENCLRAASQEAELAEAHEICNLTRDAFVRKHDRSRTSNNLRNQPLSAGR